MKKKFTLFAKIICLILVSQLFLVAHVNAAAPLLPSDLRGDSISFLPYLEYMLDENGTFTIDTLTQQQSSNFLPLRPLDIDLKAGTYWLRFVIAPVPEGTKSVEWLLSLGESLPGDPTFYYPEGRQADGVQRYRAIAVTDRHILNLPEAGIEPKACYIRIAGPPGLWFAPVLRSPHNAANNWGALAHPASVLGLGIVMLLCLLRCFSEGGQWRIWTVLYVGGSLAAGYLGLPTLEKGHIGFSQFATALAPGIALMLLPHVARHMMCTSKMSRIVDAQLILLTLIGACVSLFPLVPGYSQTARFLEIWPVCTIFFIPTAFWAMFIGLPASQRFLFICIIPPICTAAAVLGLFSGLSPDYLSALPLCGVAVSALLLVAAPNPSVSKNALENDLDIALPKEKEKIEFLSMGSEEKKQENTRKKQGENAFEALQIHSSSESNEPTQSIPKILSLVRGLEELSLGKKIKSHIVSLREQVEQISNEVLGTHYGSDIAQTVGSEQDNVIDLQYLMRSMYACAVQESKDTGIALGWYMPPELPTLYQGDAQRLHAVLLQLVESAVATTTQGSVHFTVRHYPRSDDPAHLLFTITDTGDPKLSGLRSGRAVANAWDLAASLDGAVTILNDAQGMTVSMALHLEVLNNFDAALRNPLPLIILCSKDPSFRSKIKEICAHLKCRFAEASTITEGQEIHASNPAILFIIHDTLATPKASILIRTIRKQAKDVGLPLCKILAVTKTDENWKELGAAGFTHALPEPLDEEALRETVSKFISIFQQDTKKNIHDVNTKPMANLFAKSPGTVPKDIDELMGIARVLNSFSSLGDISKQVEAKEESILSKNKSDDLLQNQQQNSYKNKSQNFSDTAKDNRSIDESNKKIQRDNQVKEDPLDDETLIKKYMEEDTIFTDKSDQNQVSSEKKSSTQETEKNSQTWSGESENAAAQQTNNTDGDEWVGEPFPVAKSRAEPEPSTEPAILAFIGRLDEALNDAKDALAASQSQRVAEAAAKIAAECDSFSFRVVARVARCVERAGKAGDLDAARHLLKELENQIERNNIALLESR